MNKYFCFILFLLTIQLNAQNFGVKIGINYSEITNENSEKAPSLLPEFYTKKRFGPNIGFFYNQPLIKYVDLQCGILYSQTGAIDKYSITSIDENTGYITNKDKYIVDHQLDNLQFTLCLQPQQTINDISIFLSIGSTYTIPFCVSNFYMSDLNMDSTFGYLFGFGIVIPKILYYPILIEINKNNDFNNFHTEYKLRMNCWSLKLGIYLK